MKAHKFFDDKIVVIIAITIITIFAEIIAPDLVKYIVPNAISALAGLAVGRRYLK